jgi:murein DD-endopeptidase MepM/ murein hydrolase activator NlpD
VEENQHAVSRDQRFALDLVVLAPDVAAGSDAIGALASGKSHRGNGRSNDQYYCHGRPILAPGDGVVVALKDGVPENAPGERGSDPPGNFLVINHGDDEFSMLAHLMPGSLIVNVGDRVTEGQRLAACGNSGRSTEPHLHYHLQNTPRWFDADGLPAQFRDYFADGERVSRGELLRGQLVHAGDH